MRSAEADILHAKVLLQEARRRALAIADAGVKENADLRVEIAPPATRA